MYCTIPLFQISFDSWHPDHHPDHHYLSIVQYSKTFDGFKSFDDQTQLIHTSIGVEKCSTVVL